jgi:hypothetical protein
MELPKVYKEYFLHFETLISIVLTIALYVIFSKNLTPDQFTTLLTDVQSKVYPVTSIGAITLLGFIITGISILITFTETPSLKPLKTSRQYPTLFKIYFSAIRHLGVLTFLSILGILVNQKDVALLIFYLVILFIFTSTLRIWRCLWVLEQFIQIIQIPPIPPT